MKLLANTVDESTLIKWLGGEEKAKSIFIDPAVNFASGKVTSTFDAIKGDTSPYYKVSIYSMNNGNETEIKTKTFSQKDKLNTWLVAERDKAYNDFKELEIQNNKDIKENEIKNKFKNFLIWKIGDTQIEDILTDDLLKEIDKISPENINTFDQVGTASTLTAGIYSGAKAFVEDPDFLLKASENLVNNLTEIVANNAMELITSNTDIITKHVLNAPNIIKQKAQTIFNENKKTFSEIYKQLGPILTSEEIDNQLQDWETEQESKSQNKFMSTVIKVKNYVAKFSADLNNTLSNIAPYIAEGPQTILTFINNAIAEQVSKYNGIINEEVNSWMKLFDDKCESIGEIKGKQLADKYNEELLELAKKRKNDLETEKAKGRTIAFSVKQKANLKISSLTGVNIKIPNTISF